MTSQATEVKPYRQLVITPAVMGEVAKQFWAKRAMFPYNLGAEPERLTAILTADDTAVFEIGEFGGILYFTEVKPGPECSEHEEPTAQAHIFIWDKAWYGKSSILNELCRDFMRGFEIRRLYAEIPSTNSLAILAARNVGFRIVGTLRGRIPVKRGMRDTCLMDAMLPDLEAKMEYHTVGDPEGDISLIPAEGDDRLGGMLARAESQAGVDPFSTGDTHYWLIVAGGDEQACGYTGIHSIDFVSRRCRGVLWLAPECRGAGIGERALRLRNGFLFDRYEMNRIEWAVRTDNAAMLATSDKLGEREGTVRQAAFHDGAYHDYALYAVLRPKEDK